MQRCRALGGGVRSSLETPAREFPAGLLPRRARQHRVQPDAKPGTSRTTWRTALKRRPGMRAACRSAFARGHALRRGPDCDRYLPSKGIRKNSLGNNAARNRRRGKARNTDDMCKPAVGVRCQSQMDQLGHRFAHWPGLVESSLPSDLPHQLQDLPDRKTVGFLSTSSSSPPSVSETDDSCLSTLTRFLGSGNLCQLSPEPQPEGRASIALRKAAAQSPTARRVALISRPYRMKP